MKKKKTFEFINSKSLELIKSIFPKKLDLIINQIKTKKNEEQQTKIPNEIVIDLKNRPSTACIPSFKDNKPNAKLKSKVD